MVFVVKAQGQITAVSAKTWIFLMLSGVATGASWLCYFKALQLGDVNRVVPIDKSSTILTIILAFIFFKGDKRTQAGMCGAYSNWNVYDDHQKGDITGRAE